MFSSFASSPSEVMLTKQHFEFSLPAGRCSSSEEESLHKKLFTVDGYWKLENYGNEQSVQIARHVFSTYYLAGRLLHPTLFVKLLYGFCCLSLVFLHTVKGYSNEHCCLWINAFKLYNLFFIRGCILVIVDLHTFLSGVHSSKYEF